MVVTTTNLYSESRNVLKTLINSKVTDPKIGTTNSRRRWIYREFPDTTSRNFQGYPFIVITSPDAEDDIVDLQGSLSDGSLSFEVNVYAEFDDENARVDEISSQIYGLFRNKTHIQTLADANMFRGSVESSPFDNTAEDGKKLSGRQFSIDFETTLEDNS